MDGKRTENAIKDRGKRWIRLALPALLLVAGIGFIYHVIRSKEGHPFKNPLIVLAVIDIFLLVTLFYLLFRQLIKGYLQWRRVKEGARIRTRLLTAFVLLGLIPSTLLLISAVLMIESAVDKWFTLPVHTVNEAGQRLVDASLDLLRTGSARRADSVAKQLEAVPEDLQPSFVSHIVKGGDIDAVWLFGSDGATIKEWPSGVMQVDAFKKRKCFSEDGLRGYIVLGDKSYVLSGSRVGSSRAVIVGYLLPEKMLTEARFIAENQKLYLQAKAERQFFKISMVSSFLALTLAVIFAAVWIGMKLTREISKPLQLLLEGTEEVSRGNLDLAIPYEAKDEIGTVVSSFNKMVDDLKESKREIVKSNQELREASEAAERRRHYIETLVESLNVGIVSIGRDGELLTANNRAREFLGLSKKDLPAKIVTLPVWQVIKDSLRDLSRHPEGRKEVTISQREETRVMIASLVPISDAEGEVSRSILILEDVTDLSRTQRIAAWQEVARRLAHEIKNPLTPIRLSAQRIRKKAREGAEDLHEAILEGTTTIEKEVESMMLMVNEFSRFARLPEVKLRWGSLSELVLTSAAPYQNAYPKVRFSFDLPEAFPQVMFDHEQLERVVKNLFENSIEAMKMAGEIQVSLSMTDKWACVSIRDTGPGIPHEIREKMFLPYFSTKKKGMGLGMAIVARILEEHGGRIEVDGSYAGGAGMTIFLPR
ncbi:MAG TPA: ATP-binding protein [Acidobacteriota bacterium]|jgi:two-component system nitrogen regulation sensor histidine kinase NtrY|nr:ATP-binding protein [Acidobacteriota bacterium]HQO19454.1 ATP-binding protein [Acidobacteriota bacterium]HQQ46014.1 ATP-binding protein [Acidobacteriota bacterium]